jgi:hypothetical protein
MGKEFGNSLIPKKGRESSREEVWARIYVLITRGENDPPTQTSSVP